MNRRNFLGLLAAPTVIRVAGIMPDARPVYSRPELAAPYKGMVQFVGNPMPFDHDPYRIYYELCHQYAKSMGLGVELLGSDHAKNLTRARVSCSVGSVGDISSEELVRRIAQT